MGSDSYKEEFICSIAMGAHCSHAERTCKSIETNLMLKRPKAASMNEHRLALDLQLLRIDNRELRGLNLDGKSV